MKEEIHVLFDLEKTLSESLDHLIMDTSNMSIFGAQRKSLNDLIGRASWRECLAHIRSTFDRLADPDAAEIVPIFKRIFDEKKALVKSLDVSQSLKDEILFALSTQRKNMGIDHKRFKQDDDTAQRLEIAH